MTINIHGTGIELTDAIRAYAEEKIAPLEKFFDNIQQINIDLGRTTHHHHKGEVFYVEVNIHVPGHMLRVVKEEPDLYKAIDKVKDHMKVEIESMKEKMRQKDKGEIRDQKEYKAEE